MPVTRRNFYIAMIYGLWSIIAAALSIPAAIYLLIPPKLRKMAEWVDGHFDPQVFQAFVKCVGIYPIGSLVKLQSGRLGVVMDQTPDSLLNPRVKVFYSTRSHTRINPVIIDLSKPQCEETIVSREDPAKWQFPGLNEMWAGPQGR